MEAPAEHSSRKLSVHGNCWSCEGDIFSSGHPGAWAQLRAAARQGARQLGMGERQFCGTDAKFCNRTIRQKAGMLCSFLVFQAGEQHMESKAVLAIPRDLRQACPSTTLPFFPHAITLSSLFLALPAASQHASLYQKCSTRVKPSIP